MKATIFLNPDGVDNKRLEDIYEKLIDEGIDYNLYENQNDLVNCDFAIAFGGDGTILHAAKKAALLNKSVLGINGGNLGYTAGIEAYELDLLSKIKNNEYSIDKRMMFEVCVKSEGKEHRQFCINDAVVSKGSLSRIIDITLSVSGKNLLNLNSDGVIVSTPTGSTAYSLSAGGPILDPTIKSILVTAICPHTFFGRPVVINDEEIVEININSKKNTEAYLTVDGETSIKLAQGDIVSIKKAENITANLIRLKNESFMQILHNKFWGKR